MVEEMGEVTANTGSAQSEDQAQIFQLLSICMQTPGVGGSDRALGLPVLLWGMPGVAKTARINQIVEVLNGVAKAKPGEFSPWFIQTVLASIRQPEDFLGTPVPYDKPVVDARGNEKKDPDGKPVTEPALIYYPPEWVRELQNNIDNPGPDDVGRGRKGVLFLDEFATAAPAVQAALLRVVHERVVGDEPLPRNTAMIAAANPPAMSPGGEAGISLPTANRFIHLFWPSPSKDQWSAWLMGLQNDEATLPFVDLDRFAEYYDTIKDWGATFMAKPDAELFEMPPEGQLEAAEEAIGDNFDAMAYAWPSPRSWEIALRAAAGALAAVDSDKKPLSSEVRNELAKALICAAVGEKACMNFNTWLDNRDMLPMEMYLDPHNNPFVPNKSNPQRTQAFTRQMWIYASHHPDQLVEALAVLMDLYANKRYKLPPVWTEMITPLIRNWVKNPAVIADVPPPTRRAAMQFIVDIKKLNPDAYI